MPFSYFKSILERLDKLERDYSELSKKHEKFKQDFYQKEFIRKSQILRVKNQEELSNDYLTKDLDYLDLSPEKAFRLYNEVDLDFVLLDVSEPTFEPTVELPEAINIPLEEIIENVHQIKGSGKSIFVISEKGLRSIQACKLLSQLGFCNLNNISGGHKFWPAARAEQTPSLDESDNTASDEFTEEDFLKEA